MFTPEECFDEIISKTMAFQGKAFHLESGMHFVLYYLFLNKKKQVFSGDLSKSMGVSSARTSALLNGLEKKGWIIREKTASDSRKTIIRITEAGELEILSKRNKVCETLRYVMSEISEEDIRHFIETSKRIKYILERKMKDEEDS